MYLSYRWLNEFVKVDDLDPHEIGHRLTMCTSEIEAVQEVGGNLDKVVIGKILDVKLHPDSDHLFLTRIDVGSETLDIVSGAPNTVEGSFVPVALIGARLPGGMKVKKAKLRGAVSCGVVCSEKELDISDDHTGLWILDADGVNVKQLKPGTPLEQLFGTHDYIFEIDNQTFSRSVQELRTSSFDIGIRNPAIRNMNSRGTRAFISTEGSAEGTSSDGGRMIGVRIEPEDGRTRDVCTRSIVSPVSCSYR